MYRGVAAGQAFWWQSLAELTLRPDLPVLPAHPAVVAQRCNGGEWRYPTTREHRRLYRTADSRCLFAVELAIFQSRAFGAHPEGMAHESGARFPQLHRGLGAGGSP